MHHHGEEDRQITLSSLPPEPPVGAVGQLPGLLQNLLCSAHKGVALQNPGRVPVDLQVHIHKPLYALAFASASLASHCLGHAESRASQSIKIPELVFKG